MLQTLFSDIDDLIVFLIFLYVTLVYLNVLGSPSIKWEQKKQNIKRGKFGNLAKIELPLLTLGFLLRIILHMSIIK
jgi:hypothetical protein